MKTRISRGAASGAVLLTLLFPSLGRAFPGGPPNFRTWCGNQGADAVCSGSTCSSCASCHGQFGGPNTGSGSVTIENLPATYEAGVQYTLAVFLQDTANVDFAIGGFEVSALTALGLCQAGSLMMDAPNTRVDTDGTTGTQWLKQSSPQDAVAGTAMWQFLWTAPDPAVGDVAFNVCANAANDGDGSDGDRIYCSEAIVSEGSAPLVEPTIFLAKEPLTGEVALSWAESSPCFGVHRGPLADVGEIVTVTGAYEAVECGVRGNSATDLSLGDPTSYFYLVVPNGPGGEGVYGCSDTNSDGACDADRLASQTACAACP